MARPKKTNNIRCGHYSPMPLYSIFLRFDGNEQKARYTLDMLISVFFFLAYEPLALSIPIQLTVRVCVCVLCKRHPSGVKFSSRKRPTRKIKIKFNRNLQLRLFVCVCVCAHQSCLSLGWWSDLLRLPGRLRRTKGNNNQIEMHMYYTMDISSLLNRNRAVSNQIKWIWLRCIHSHAHFVELFAGDTNSVADGIHRCRSSVPFHSFKFISRVSFIQIFAAIVAIRCFRHGVRQQQTEPRIIDSILKNM